MPESGNRYVRVIAPPGPFSVRYEAEIDLQPMLDPPALIREVAVEKLPLSVFPHLYPSRYCQSDKLDRLAQRTFGDKPAGYEPVKCYLQLNP